jgi:hypothetical protein
VMYTYCTACHIIPFSRPDVSEPPFIIPFAGQQ